jgi:hypothetical protein
MSESELRRLLADAVPEAAPAGDRAEGARRWARRRRNRHVAGVSIAAVAIAIGIPVGLAQRSDQRVEPAPQPKVFACPAAEPAPTALPPTPGGPGRLSPGAVAVRLCNRYAHGNPGSFGAYQEPVDPLVGPAVEELAERIRTVGPVRKSTYCDLMFAPSYYFVFSYPDGHIEGVTAKTGNCSAGVTVGDAGPRGDGQDAAALFEQFSTALLAQRVDEHPPADAQAPVHCDARGSNIAPNQPLSPLRRRELPDLTKAVLCWYPNRFSAQPTQEATFAPDDLRTVLESMKRDSSTPATHPAASCEQGTINYQIVGENAWGDRYALDGRCGDFNLRAYGGLQHWRPAGESAAIFARLLAKGTARLALPTATASPEDVLFTWADLINAADARADGLWIGGRSPGAADHPPVFISPGKGGVLPNGKRRTSVAGYAEAVEMDALWGDSTATCPDNRAKTFVLVRQSDAEPWRILSWSDHGLYQHGLGC